ncbi:MAG: SAM-dependent methyltransferase [bacterium]
MPIAAHPALARALEAELKGGAIPFARFMELALYHPEGGYYRQPQPRIGREGDFKTSPHQSPWFGRMTARQLEALWEALGRPAPFTLIEYGPGEGWLAHDILESLGEGAFAASLEYLLIERSGPAEGRIRERLAPWMKEAAGLPRARCLKAPPDAFEGAVLAHEFLDALPVHLIVRSGGVLRERYVEMREGGLAFCEGPLSDDRLAGWFDDLGVSLAEGQSAEVSPGGRDWIGQTAGRLHRGGVLIFDYGFSSRVLHHPSRKEGTLRGYREHILREDILERPGETDLTAHVDFTAILRAAEAGGLTLAGFTDQCHFLLGLGLAEALGEAGEEGGGGDAASRRKAMGLLDPAGLGSAIKVMLLTRGMEGAAFPAFAMKPDDRESLATLRGETGGAGAGA